MNRLKELRNNAVHNGHKMKQTDLAELLEVTKLTISNWENGKHEIKADKANEIAKLFNVSVSYLLGYSDKEERRETAIDRGFSMQGLLDENSALRNENRRLINELTNSYKVNAKANLLDIIISEGYVLQSTLDKCIGKLDEIDQLEIKKYYEGENQ